VVGHTGVTWFPRHVGGKVQGCRLHRARSLHAHVGSYGRARLAPARGACQQRLAPAPFLMGWLVVGRNGMRRVAPSASTV
jgi:hypothetical protein